MSKHKDTIVGVVVIALSVALFIATFFIKEFTRTSLGADFVPRITAVIFAILGLVLILRECKANALAAANPPPAKQEKKPVEKHGVQGLTAVILNIALFTVYLLLLDRIGFVILTPIYIFLQILLLTDPAKYKLGWYAVLSVVVGVASYYMFVNFFQVMLPNGILS